MLNNPFKILIEHWIVGGTLGKPTNFSRISFVRPLIFFRVITVNSYILCPEVTGIAQAIERTMGYKKSSNKKAFNKLPFVCCFIVHLTLTAFRQPIPLKNPSSNVDFVVGSSSVSPFSRPLNVGYLVPLVIPVNIGKEPTLVTRPFYSTNKVNEIVFSDDA